jgi:DNA segregation ATPase FtsK/SpoIIIE-like protein
LCAAWSCSPKKVKILIIATGTKDLMCFNRLSNHLLHPVINDTETAINALLTVRAIKDERVKDPADFSDFPHYLIYIDEYLSLISEAGDKQKILADCIENLLRHGFHGRLHTTAATHVMDKDTLKTNLKASFCRMVFKCSSAEHYRSALGEGGAVKLDGNGDMHYCTMNDTKHLRGAYISDEELSEVIEQINQKYDKPCEGDGHEFVIRDFDDLVDDETIDGVVSNKNSLKATADKKQFAKVILWALQHSYISTNMIKKAFGMGWDKASEATDRLHELEVIGDMEGKSRPVLLKEYDALSPDIRSLMESISENDIIEAFNARA